MSKSTDIDRDAFDRWGYSPLEGPIRSVQETAWAAWQASKEHYSIELSHERAIELVDDAVGEYFRKYDNSPDTEEVVRITMHTLAANGVNFKQTPKSSVGNNE